LVALRQFGQHAGGSVEAPEVGPAFASKKLEDALAVRAPNGRVLASGTGRRLIPKDALSDIVVEFCGEVSWFRVLRCFQHPQVRLGVGIYRLVLRSDKSELFTVGAKGETIHVHINCR